MKLSIRFFVVSLSLAPFFAAPPAAVHANTVPTANPGGPYSTCTGQPLQLDGSGSVDPDGDALSFAWDFDASNGITVEATVAMPVHTYSVVGSFIITLTVTDNGTPPLSNTATISVTVNCCCQASVSRCPSTPPVNLTSNAGACFYIEPVGGCFNAADVTVATVAMKYGSGAILPTGAGTLGDVCPANLIQELNVCFSKVDLNNLFSSLPVGTTPVSVTIEASTTTGCKVQGTITFDVKKTP